MDLFSTIPAASYSRIFLLLTTLLAFVTILRYAHTGSNKALMQPYSVPMLSALLCVVLVLFIGLRDPHSRFFADTAMYAHSYNNIIDGAMEISLETEWLWNNIAHVCHTFGLDVHGYFIVVAGLYFGLAMMACHRLMKHNVWIAFMFFFTSFSCYGYAVNGLRNGVACSVLTYAIALMCDKKKPLIIAGLVLGILSTGIHRSVLLPLVAAVAGMTVIKKPQWAIAFWVASIFISLLVGNAVGDMFATMGFDDRTHYFEDAGASDAAGQFSQTGFRFDFLLYSAMPVLMAWYVTVKRNFNDRAYNILAVVYILANAFWVMVIRAEFSNRFAYLSWFLYPIVIAYPLLRFKMWPDQDRKTAIILTLYVGFRLFMSIIYYA